MKDRWALSLLGVWVMGSLMLFVVAPTNFRVVDELLGGSDNTSFRALVERLGNAPTRELLRYLSSELNRELFFKWNLAQLPLGALVFWLLPRGPGTRALRGITLGAIALVLVLLLVLTPLITQVGRSLDFVPRDPPPPQLARFQLLHVAYTGLEVVKVALVAAVTYRLARRAP